MSDFKTVYQDQKMYFSQGNTQSIRFRLQKLKLLKELLLENEKYFYEALNTDFKKPKEEVFLSEFLGVIHELNTCISKLKKWSKEKRKPTPLLLFPARSSIIPEPLGQILIISPWNYPLDLCLTPTIGAVAAGNVVMIKPSEYTPHTSQLIREILAKVFPQNYVNVQCGDEEMSKQLLDLRFDYIFFTGSVNVGKIVMKKAAEYLTPVTLELGGKSPVVIEKGTDIKRAAKSLAWGKFFNAGQTCVAPDYAFIHENDFDDFVFNFKSYTQQFMRNKNHDYTAIINKKHFNRLTGYLTQGSIVCGGNFSWKEYHIEPTIIVPDSTNVPIMQEEIFGPILPVIKYNEHDDVLQFIKSREKPLAAYIFTNNNKSIKYFLKNISAGNICINDTLLNFSNKNLPFGGVGQSGMGRYHGKNSFETFSNYKSVVRKFNPDLPLRYPPYKKQYKTLRRFISFLNKSF